MKKVLFLMCLVFLAPILCSARIEPEYGCRNNPAVIGKCFTVHGRLSAYNGTPSFRLWPIGTKRLIGILPSENEIMPDSIKEHLDFLRDIYGDFLCMPIYKCEGGANAICLYRESI